MTDNFQDNLKKECRLENRISASDSASISFKPPGSDWEYQIKLRDFSASGLGLLVKEDSALLKYIRVGDVFSVNYHEDSDPMTVRAQTVKIRHISFPASGMPEKHMIVGLSFFEQESES
jgi:hypothetical protein